MYTHSEDFKTHLILGGAKSGKTSFAEKLAIDSFKKTDKLPIYLATAQAFDKDMEQKINLHRKERANKFKTLEYPFNIAEPLLKAGSDDLILIDCLTLFVSNLLCKDHFDEEQIELFKEAITITRAKLIIVSNETGLGIIPNNKLSRKFRDVAGKLNQEVATLVERVTLIIAGLPLTLKPN